MKTSLKKLCIMLLVFMLAALLLFSGCSGPVMQEKNPCEQGHLVRIGKCSRCGEIVNKDEYWTLCDTLSAITSTHNLDFLEASNAYIESNFSGSNEAVNLATCCNQISNDYKTARDISSKYSELSDITQAIDRCSESFDILIKSYPAGSNFSYEQIQQLRIAFNSYDTMKDTLKVYEQRIFNEIYNTSY